MRLFVYEHLSANHQPDAGSLAVEGRAMLEAVLADLARAPNLHLSTMIHPNNRGWRVPPEVSVFNGGEPLADIFARTDVETALLIAPEIGGILHGVVDTAKRFAVRLLGPHPGLVDRFGDKVSAEAFFGDALIPSQLLAPRSEVEAPEESWTRVVVKPRDGAGALLTALTERARLRDTLAKIEAAGFRGELLVQPFIEGLVASIVVVGQQDGTPCFLPAVEQILRFEADGPCTWIHYAGGRGPMDDRLQARAEMLAYRVWDSAGPWLGYAGIDLILGAAADASDDRILEVNPRLTTSYVLYHHLFADCLGRILLGRATTNDRAAVRRVPSVKRVRFHPDGRVEDEP